MRVPAHSGKGDQVLRKSHRDQIDYTTDEPLLLAGEYWYQVQFAGGILSRFRSSTFNSTDVALAGNRQNTASKST